MNNTLKQKVKKLNTRSTYGKGTDTVRVRSHAIVTPIQPTFARVPYRSPAPGVCVCVSIVPILQSATSLAPAPLFFAPFYLLLTILLGYSYTLVASYI